MDVTFPSTVRDRKQQDITVELVWDADLDATAISGRGGSRSGSPVRVGPGAGWLPAHHLTLAAASSFMIALIQLAQSADVPILGYVAIAKLCVPVDPREIPHVTLNPCIVVGTPDDATKAAALATEAAESSEICRIFRGRLLVNPDIQVIDAVAEPERP